MSLAPAVGFEALGRSAEWNYPERDGDTSQLGIIRVPTVVYTLVNELPEKKLRGVSNVLSGCRGNCGVVQARRNPFH